MNNYILIALIVVCVYALAKKLVKLALTVGAVALILYLIDNASAMLSMANILLCSMIK